MLYYNFTFRNIKEAKRLQVVAEQAKNTTLEAYNLAKKAIAKYTNIRYFYTLLYKNYKNIGIL